MGIHHQKNHGEWEFSAVLSPFSLRIRASASLREILLINGSIILQVQIWQVVPVS
jgi:hypothetical protein